MSQLFNIATFKNHLRTGWLGSEFIYHQTVDSTNTRLKKIPISQLSHGTVMLADYQTEGRGQHQKKWVSDPAQNLTFTIAYLPGSVDRATLLTLSAAYAILEVVEKYTREKVCIKWPNDLLINSRKVAGILTECIFLGSNLERILIGIGFNIGQQQFDPDLTENACSLSQFSDKEVVRETLLAELLQSIEFRYQQWHKGSSDLHKLISQRMEGFGQWVRIHVEGELANGRYKFLGVNEKGELLLLDEQLEVKIYSHEQVRIITGNTGLSKPGRTITS
jgi:BirA family transcriptional regulator, biotin operon repressor / biotin---[acetyl-CoA-carboxylase] ligase